MYFQSLIDITTAERNFLLICAHDISLALPVNLTVTKKAVHCQERLVSHLQTELTWDAPLHLWSGLLWFLKLEQDH